MERKPKILVLSRYFAPAYKAGGPVISVYNLIQALSEQFEFIVVTGDRDRNENASFSGIALNEWHQRTDYRVIYLSRLATFPWNFVRIVNTSRPDFIYLNSFFDKTFGFPIFFLRFFCLRNVKIICAPRGELAPGALRFKNLRKRLLISLGKVSSIYGSIKWHATSVQEQSDISMSLGANASNITLIPNIFIAEKNLNYSKPKLTDKDRLQICFISRIHPKKNLEYAIERIIEADIPATFSIYGPIDDYNYWERCKERISKGPSHINITYHGAIRKEQVTKAFGKSHIFFFPTYSENFGHVILEALSAGCLVVTSDQVPWLNLRQLGIGYNISLDDHRAFVEALHRINSLDETELMSKQQSAVSFALNQTEQKSAILKYRCELFCASSLN